MIAKLVRNAGIYTPEGASPSAGKDQGAVRFLPRGAMVIRDGLIEAVGPEEEILSSLSGREVDEEIDCGGRCVIPGFVDPHTHMCFARRREEEFSLRLAGTPYLEILRKGGGILSSVRSVREATDGDLFENTLVLALSALSMGTTTVEMKSGYGLDTETELRMLSVIRRVGRETPLDVVPTFMGAHAVPELYRGNGDGYVDLIVEEMLPAVEEQGIARFCDVFCEEGVFSVSQTERILAEASGRGLGLKVHADEVHDTGGAASAARSGVVSAGTTPRGGGRGRAGGLGSERVSLSRGGIRQVSGRLLLSQHTEITIIPYVNSAGFREGDGVLGPCGRSGSTVQAIRRPARC